MKTFLMTALLAVCVSPVMAGNGWDLGRSTSAAYCKPTNYGNNYSSAYRSNNYGSNYSNNYSNNYGPQFGSSNNNRWTPAYNTSASRWNNSRIDYDYNYKATRNTRYDNHNHSHHVKPVSFSPWSPSYNYNRGY